MMNEHLASNTAASTSITDVAFLFFCIRNHKTYHLKLLVDWFMVMLPILYTKGV